MGKVTTKGSRLGRRGGKQSIPAASGPWQRLLVWTLGAIGAAIVVLFVAINMSPRPGTRLIRHIFESGAAGVKSEMEKHAPTGVTSLLAEPYRSGDDDALLDVYFPEGTASGVQLPTLVWTHGGAWISGHRDDAAPWLQLVANAGYTVVAVGYSIAPRHEYPLPVTQVNDALAWLLVHAERLHIDPDRIVMAGDSSGAQITTQVAALTTNPAYASEMGMTPSLKPDQLRGVALFCGIFDMEAFTGDPGDANRLLAWGVRTVLWSYTGSRDTRTTALRQMSTIDAVTAAFPPAFITGGNADPLTGQQSRPFANRLAELGIDTTTRFFPADHTPGLGHEYQFNLDNTDGQAALQAVLAFLQQHTA